MAGGAGWDVVREMLRLPFSESALQSMGFHLSSSEIGSSRLDEEDKQFAIDFEAEWLEALFRLVFAMAGRRAMSLQAYEFAFPWRAAQLLHTDRTVVRTCLDYWKGVASDWSELCKSDNPAVKTMMQRNFMNSACAHDFLEHLSAKNWDSLSPSLEANLRTGFSISETLVIENCIKASRASVKREQENHRMCIMRRWITPLARKIPDGVFKYKVANFKKVLGSEVRLKKKSLPRRWFKAPRRKTSLPIDGILGKSARAPFVTWNAQSQKMQFADLLVLRAALHNRTLDRLHLSWLSLLAPPLTLFKEAGSGDSAWYISLANMGVSGVLAIPCHHSVIAGRSLFSLRTEFDHSEAKWFSITELDDFVGHRLVFRGPVFKSFTKMHTSMPLVYFEPLDQEPMSLGALAAHYCFYSLGPVILGRLIAHYKVVVAVGATLFDQLNALVKYFLPDVTQETLLSILSRRVPPNTEETALDGFDFTSVLEQEDVDEFSKSEGQVKKENDLKAPFAKAFLKLHQEFVAKTSAGCEPAKKKARGKAKTGAASSSWPGGRKMMQPLKDESLSKEAALQWLPEGMRLSKDSPNGRWLAVDKRPPPPPCLLPHRVTPRLCAVLRGCILFRLCLRLNRGGGTSSASHFAWVCYLVAGVLVDSIRHACDGALRGGHFVVAHALGIGTRAPHCALVFCVVWVIVALRLSWVRGQLIYTPKGRRLKASPFSV